MQLSSEQIDRLCEEVEQQWLHHMMVRAAFPNKFVVHGQYRSRTFYRNHGIDLLMEWPDRTTDSFRVGARGLTVWLNQNWVIRLYGILDSHKLIKYGKEHSISVVQLIDLLRNNIGAHSAGRGAVRSNKLEKANSLMLSAIGKEVDLNTIESFDLAVDSVLFPIKNEVVEFLLGLKATGS